MSIRLAAALLLTTFLAVGCASSHSVAHFQPDRDRTTYTSRPITVLSQVSTSSYGSTTTIKFRVESRCQGRACVPDRDRIVFFLSTAGASARTSLPDRSLQLSFAGERIEWDDPAENRRDGGRISAGAAFLLEVDLPREKLERLATARRVQGRLSTQTFQLDFDDLAPLRAYLNAAGTAPSSGP